MNLIALFRQAAPRLLWSGQLVSAAGDRLYAAALTWLTLRLTGSPGAVSLVTLAGTLPFLASSAISGALADRHDGLRLARAANIAQVLAVSAVPVAYLAGHLDLVILAAAAAGLSALEAFCLPVLQASLPRLVERQWLTPMVSLLDTTDRLARVIGPGAVGALIAFLPAIHLFTIDAASFAVSAWCLGRVARRARLALLARAYTAQRLVVVAATAAGLPAAAITVSRLGAPAALALAGAFITGAAALAGARRISPWTWRRPGPRG